MMMMILMMMIIMILVISLRACMSSVHTHTHTRSYTQRTHVLRVTFIALIGLLRDAWNMVAALGHVVRACQRCHATYRSDRGGGGRREGAGRGGGLFLVHFCGDEEVGSSRSRTLEDTRRCAVFLIGGRLRSSRGVETRFPGLNGDQTLVSS